MQTEVETRVPADKSITHRALVLAALASGRSRIGNALAGADTMATAGALRALGVAVPPLGEPVVIDGRGLRGLQPGGAALDCHNSGTTARLLLGVLSGYSFDSEITGDASLRSRPMRRVTTPLALMGALFTELGETDRLPVRVRGGSLRSVHYDSPHASAQVKSAILLAGLTGAADVSITEPRLSRDHTERMLGRLGVRLERSVAGDGRPALTLHAAQQLDPFEIDVPGDISSAAFMAAFALLARRSIRIPDVGLNPTRTGFIDVVLRMGGRIRIENERESCGEPVGDLVVEPSDLTATHITGAEMPALVDEVPVLAMLAARAEGTTVIEGAEELRIKESDRIRALVDGLRAIGVEAHERAAGLEVVGTDAELAGRVVTHGDHRIAMSFGVLGSAGESEVTVDDPDAAGVSFPGFWRELRRLIRETA